MKLFLLSAMTLASLGGCASTASSSNQDPDVDRVMAMTIDAYQRCIVDESGRLEISGEPSRSVVAAAITSCVAARNRALEVTGVWAMVNQGLNANSAGQVAVTAVERAQREAQDNALLAITNIRANRRQ